MERHLGLSFDFMMEFLGGPDSSALQLDPSGERPLKTAKELRRRVIRDTGRRNVTRLQDAAQEHFGLPTRPLELLGPDSQQAPLARGRRLGAVPARPRERRPLNADEVVRRLGLQPHPEGGYYRETFRSSERLHLPDGRVRPASTAIHYLLTTGSWSTWHRVRSDEVWHHYDGGRSGSTGSDTPRSGSTAGPRRRS